ncbi:hypothetical protein KR222_010285 [Zaprionus bogoriensis]|nr:hypothetical protein KR222_010285 [Zaprionus bogoriensis]
MISENTLLGNPIVSAEKSSSTGAVVNLKKLLKTVKRIFTNPKPKMAKAEDEIEVEAVPSFASEEELQNWLNEQIEAKQMAAN